MPDSVQKTTKKKLLKVPLKVILLKEDRMAESNTTVPPLQVVFILIFLKVTAMAKGLAGSIRKYWI
jgi:hypothetical protein